MNNFTANDIKAGYLGVFKNGEKAIAMPTDKELKFVELRTGESAIDCENSFDQASWTGEYNLVALYGYPNTISGFSNWFSTADRPLLWKREPVATEMTIAEIEAKLGVEKLKIIKEG